jgi:capsule polysaccharide export protein KpsE/RkpR
LSTPLATDDKVHLLDYFIVLAKYSRMIIYTSVIVALMTYFYLIILPNKYTTTACIMPPQQNMTLSAQLMDSLGGGGISKTGGPGGMASSLLGIKTTGDIYVGILSSNTVIDSIIRQFDLRKIYNSETIEDARLNLRKNSVISVGKKDGLINIEVTDIDPKRAAAIANAYIKELDNVLQELQISEAKGRLAFLEKERSQSNYNLAKAEEALRTFSEQSSVIQIDAQTKGMLEYIANLKANIDAREIQIQVLRKQATPYNYDVIRLETELQGLKDKLKAAKMQIDQASATDVWPPTSKVPTLGLEYMRLYRETKFQEVLFELYNKLCELARLDMAKNLTVLQVIDTALPPERRSNQRMLPSVLAGALTFILMIFVAFGRNYLEHIRNQEDEAQRLSYIVGYLDKWKDGFFKLKR